MLTAEGVFLTRSVCFTPDLREKQLLNGRLRIHREKLQSMETTLKNTRKGDKGGMVSYDTWRFIQISIAFLVIARVEPSD